MKKKYKSIREIKENSHKKNENRKIGINYFCFIQL